MKISVCLFVCFVQLELMARLLKLQQHGTAQSSHQLSQTPLSTTDHSSHLSSMKRSRSSATSKKTSSSAGRRLHTSVLSGSPASVSMSHMETGRDVLSVRDHGTSDLAATDP